MHRYRIEFLAIDLHKIRFPDFGKDELEIRFLPRSRCRACDSIFADSSLSRSYLSPLFARHLQFLKAQGRERKERNSGMKVRRKKKRRIESFEEPLIFSPSLLLRGWHRSLFFLCSSTFFLRMQPQLTLSPLFLPCRPSVANRIWFSMAEPAERIKLG